MAMEIKTRASGIIAAALEKYYDVKKIAVINPSTVFEKAMIKLFQNAEDYCLAKTPVNLSQGVAESEFLYVIVGNLFRHFFLLKDRNTEYKVGTITAAIASRGLDFAQATKMLSLTPTKSAVNNMVDTAAGLLITGSFEAKADFSQVTKDFVYSVLTDRKYRTATINRILNSFVMPHSNAIDQNAVAELTAIITLGRGEALSPDQVPLHNILRSLVIAMLREMIDWGLKERKHEIFYDVLSALSLFIMYVNISETDAVYDTAFPPINMSGNNPIIHGMRTKAFKQLAMMFSKVGFSGKAFHGQMTSLLLSDVFKLFPDMFDLEVYQSSTDNSIDFSSISYIKESSLRYDTAKATFDSVLPSMFKGYVQDVINEIKTQTGTDLLIPTMFDEVKGAISQDKIFKDLSTQYLGTSTGKDGKSVIVLNPESSSEGPITMLDKLKIREMQKFLLTNVFVAVENLHKSAVSLKGAYDKIFSTLGTPTGGLIQGVSVELELLSSDITDVTPILDDITQIKYARLDECYSVPFVMPPLAIRRDDMSQVWVLSDLKYKIFRPDLLVLHYARDAKVFGLPVDADLTMFKDQNPHQRWSWLKSAIPTPTHMHDSSFAYTPLPYNYTFDTVFDSVAAKGLSIDRMMTRSGRIPSLGYMSYGETIAAYVNAGTVNPRDIALAVAGLGFIYIKQESKKWNKIDPEIPTIYGMPSIFMMDINNVDVNSLLTIKDGIAFPGSPDKNKDVNRLIFDRSNKEQGVGTVVLVLHKYVPSTLPLRHMLGTIRNGFSLKVPYVSQIYSILLNASQKVIKSVFDEKNEAVDKAIATHAPLPMMELAQSFNKVLTVFFMEPMNGAGKTAQEYFDDTFSQQAGGLNLTNYAAFKDFFFEEIQGFSNVIVGYPHLSMRDRYSEHSKTHFDEWLRSFTSRTYFDTSQMKNQEEITILTLTPNYMQMLDLADEDNFINNDIHKLSEIGTIGIKTVPQMEKKNATIDELSVIQGIEKRESSGEGYELVTFGSGEIKGTKSIANLTETHLDAPIGTGTTKKYGLDKGNSNELIIDTAKVTLDSQGNKNPDLMTQQPNLETFNKEGEKDVNANKTAQTVEADMGKGKISTSTKELGLGNSESDAIDTLREEAQIESDKIDEEFKGLTRAEIIERKKKKKSDDDKLKKES